MFMNRDDIDEALRLLSRRVPEAAPFAQFLADWRDVVDANSDGWPHWRQGSKSADRLMRLVTCAVDIAQGRRPREDMPTAAMFRSALTPIRRMATSRGLTAPELGDVPAADGAAPGMR